MGLSRGTEGGSEGAVMVNVCVTDNNHLKMSKNFPVKQIFLEYYDAIRSVIEFVWSVISFGIMGGSSSFSKKDLISS